MGPGGGREGRVVYVFDLRDAYAGSPDGVNGDRGYDLTLFVCTLQGIVNRDAPRLLVYGKDYFQSFSPFSNPVGKGWDGNIERLWLERFRAKGEWLEGARVVELDGVDELLEVFGDRLRGVSVWDPQVDATANVATTAAGVLDAPAVMGTRRYSDPKETTLYERLVERGRLPVACDLRGLFSGEGTIPGTNEPSTGSAKCDAYIWALEHFGPECNPACLGYYEDAYARRPGTGPLNWEALRDYLVARRAFVVDLSVWADEAPCDDPHQALGTDYSTLIRVLEYFDKRRSGGPFICVGFVPWNDKYTTHSGGKLHEPVPSEWELVHIITRYGGYLTADAANQGFTANASFHRHFPYRLQYVQNPRPAPRQLEPATYITYHMGDYCDVGGIYNLLTAAWMDEGRGKIPLGWAISPVNMYLVPDLIDYFYRTRTENDFFITGPSGFGYNSPNALPPERRQDCLALSRLWLSRMNMTIAGFVIDNAPLSPEVERLCARFAPDGVATNFDPGAHLTANVPFVHMKDTFVWDWDVEAGAAKIHALAESQVERPGEEPCFLNLRCIYTEPDYLVAVTERIKRERPEYRYEVVDPYTWYYLFRLWKGGHNAPRATVELVNVLTRPAPGGSVLTVDARVRNDGWEPLAGASLAVWAEMPDGSRSPVATAPLPPGPGEDGTLPPGGSVDFAGDLVLTGVKERPCAIAFDVADREGRPFESEGGLAYRWWLCPDPLWGTQP